MELWPTSLNTALGMPILSSVPIVMLWGVDGIMLYNDAYSVFAGGRHPGLLGMAVREAWPEVLEFNENVMRVVMEGGSTLTYRDQELTLYRHDGRPEQVWIDLGCSPVIGEDGYPAGVCAIVTETSDRVLMERRQAFRLALEETLRDVGDPTAIALVAAEALGEHLSASRVGYAEYDSEDLHVAIEGEWCAQGVPTISGRHLLSSFGDVFVSAYEAGRTVVIDDFRTDPRSMGTSAVEAHDGIEVRAQVVAPLIKDGRLVAMMFVHDSRPRAWSRHEREIIEDVAERTWAAVARARAERNLRQSEARVLLATEAAEIGFWDVDVTLDRLFWPASVKAMFGISADVPVSMEDFYNGLHPDDREAVSATYAAAADSDQRTLYDVEYRTIGREDGVIRWVAAKGRGVFNSNGRCLRVLGTAIDITRRKADEDRLRVLNESLEREIAVALAERKLLADVVDGADAMVMVLDQAFVILAINTATQLELRRVYGMNAKAGDDLLQLLNHRPGQRKHVRATWARALAGEAFLMVTELVDPGGTQRSYEMRFQPLRDAAGKLLGAYQFVYDVTERLSEQARLRETEAALQQAQKMEAVGQLTGGIAHDFNNLLQGVCGSLDLIRRRPEDVERVKRWSEAGLRAAERGTKLTSQLLAFSRAQKLEAKPVIVDDLLINMLELLERTLGPLVTVELDLAGKGALVLSDATQLEMAVLNLAINARDAMAEKGTLCIATRLQQLDGTPELSPGSYVELSVRDTGCGMPLEIASRAFDPFFTTKDVGKGTGLGLSQVYGVARQAGGAATIESRPAVGTTIRVFLRQTDDAHQDDCGHPIDAQSQGVTPASVLVIDDDPVVRRFLVDSLEVLGYRVEEAEDGPTGLEVLEAKAPDVLIVDFAMPGMNGAEVVRLARARRHDLPIVFSTGYSDTAAVESAAGQNVRVLRKPFKVAELQRAVEAALTPAI